MLNKEEFIKSVYRKSKTINKEDDFYNTEIVYKENHFIYYKIVINFLFIFVLLFGTVGSIAFTTYKILYDKPSYNWSDGSIKFNEKYNEYSKTIEEVVGTHNDTELKLVSQNYDGGFVVLEFDLKLDQEDKKYLGIGENTFSSEEIEEYRNSFNGYADEKINNYNPNLTEEENKQNVEKWKNKKIEYEEVLRKMGLEKNTVKLIFYRSFDGSPSYEIDDNKYYLGDCEKQEIEKISDLEYKIYMMYFVPDEYIENENNFTMEFESIILTATADRDILSELDEEGVPTVGGRMEYNELNLYGNFTVNVEKNDSDIKTLESDKKNIQYDILTENIEYVKVTPMQTIVKIKSSLNGLKENSLNTRWSDRNSPDLIGDISFNVYNENNEIVGSTIIESKRCFWYENGDFEEWRIHQLVPNDENRTSNGGNLEIIKYIIVSNEDYKDSLKICPTISKINNEDSRYFMEIGSFFEIEQEL